MPAFQHRTQIAVASLVLVVTAQTSCYWAHKDDVLPTSPISTPITSQAGLTNVIARAVKHVDITITIRSPLNCANTVPLFRTKLELRNHKNHVIKEVEPHDYRVTMTERLEDGKKHRLLFLSLDGHRVEKEFIATQNDIHQEFKLPCRS
ncbi:MAG: hypothetical protein HRU19_27270 [Pseudobacteriovorax sp.]|nr:hypothetical protein [Pseudobacteriovorax sp.]